MVAIGVDISKGWSYACAMGEGKIKLQKPFKFYHNKDELDKLIAFAKKFGSDARVVMEHTGVYYRVVAEALCKAGVQVSAVNPVLINQFGNNTLRKVTTDKTASMKIARYALENRSELRDYVLEDTVRDNLKAVVRQFEFADKTLTAQSNSLNALLERVFPGIDGYFDSPAKKDGHSKFNDFIIEFWHNDCVSQLSEAKFIEKYKRFCKKNHYNFDMDTPKQIHAMSRQNLTSLAKDDFTKTLITGAAEQMLHLSKRVETLRAQMITLAKQLPEFETVDAIYGVSDTLAAKLIGEIGDVRRFESKRALAAYAGVDPGKDDSGKHVSKSGKITRTGDAILRKATFQVIDCYVRTKPLDDPIYQFVDKKRSEGKLYFVYMTAGCNKFLRVYYARVMEFFAALDAPVEAQVDAQVDILPEADSAVTEPIPATAPRVRIVPSNTCDTSHAFACGQDKATLGSDLSGLHDLAYTDEGGALAAL